MINHKFHLGHLWHARRSGGLAVGFRIVFPILTLHEEDQTHWWREGVMLSYGPGSLTLDFMTRVIPHSPSELFPPEDCRVCSVGFYQDDGVCNSCGRMRYET